MGGWNVAFAGRLLADGGADVVRVCAASRRRLLREATVLRRDWRLDPGRVVQRRQARRSRSTSAKPGTATHFLRLVARRRHPARGLGARRPRRSRRRSCAPPIRAGAHVSITPDGARRGRARASARMTSSRTRCAARPRSPATPPRHRSPATATRRYHTVGLYAAICALARCARSARDRRYQHVDLSAHEAIVTCTEQVLMQWFFPRRDLGHADRAAAGQPALEQGLRGLPGARRAAE